MKIRVTLKNPDCFYEAVGAAVANSVSELELDSDEKEDLIESRSEKAWDKLEKWVEYQEYVTLEFDLETMSATVVPRRS